MGSCTQVGSTPLHQRNVCECGWEFGKLVRLKRRDENHEYLVLYGSNLRVSHIVIDACPACGKKWCFSSN